jgi:Tfp pilus assembly protein PilF
MAAKTQYDYAIYLFQQGFYEDAISHLEEVLREEETAERWSDWATAHFALSHFAEAERGFRRALQLDPELVDAAVNFGTMLATLHRWQEAIDMLERVLPSLEPASWAAVNGLAGQCRAQLQLAQESSKD